MSRSMIASLLLTVIFKCASQQTGCFLDVVSNIATTPLLITASTAFPYPSINGSLYIQTKGPMNIACPGGEFNPVGLNVHGQQAMYCAGDTRVRIISGIYLEFPTITCTNRARPFLETKLYINTEEDKCENGTNRVDIGYTVSENFYPVYSACYGFLTGVSLYVKYHMNQWVQLGQNYPDPPRYVFSYDEYWEDALEAYDGYVDDFANQGLEEYINDEHFLTKGQLAPYDDFLYVLQRDATYDLMNVAPQWNTFDEGNWRAVENGIITALQSNEIQNSTILSGTLKIATLANSTGELVQLKIGFFIHVPRWFWKLVYFADMNFGAIFIGYNNPYVDKSDVDAEFLMEICLMDVLEPLIEAWLIEGIDNSDPFLGYVYACPLNTQQIIDPVISEIVVNTLSAPNGAIYPKAEH